MVSPRWCFPVVDRPHVGTATGVSVVADSVRWVFSAGLAHMLAEDADDPLILVAVCGLELPATTPVYGVAPSLEACRGCERRSGFDVPPPQFRRHRPRRPCSDAP